MKVDMFTSRAAVDPSLYNIGYAGRGIDANGRESLKDD